MYPAPSVEMVMVIMGLAVVMSVVGVQTYHD